MYINNSKFSEFRNSSLRVQLVDQFKQRPIWIFQDRKKIWILFSTNLLEFFCLLIQCRCS